jgi:hypothetical protein
METRFIAAMLCAALAIVLPSLALSDSATPAVAQSSSAKATKAPRANTHCEADCVKYSRNGDKLTILVLDKAGKIFKAKTIALPREAGLTYRQPPHAGKVSGDEANEISTLSGASTYQYTTRGTTRVLIVTVVRLFRHDELIYASIYDHKLPIKR